MAATHSTQHQATRGAAGNWISRTRSGYTLVEMVVATASATILMGGLASSLLISNRAFLQDTTPAAEAGRSALVLAQFASDLRHALRFTERTATAVTFTVPDRNGDLLPETIRYWWSGTVGQPLMYQFNGETAVAIAQGVQQFDLAAITRTIPAEVVLPPPPPVVYEARSENKSDNIDVLSLTITPPTGTSSGKLLIAMIVTDGAVDLTGAGPPDWQLLSATTNGGNVSMGVWWKIAGAAEVAYAFNWAGQTPEQAYGLVMRFGGANVMTPINAFASSSAGVSPTPPCPSVTATEGYSMVLRLGGFDDDDILSTTNSGMANHTTIRMGESYTSGETASGGAAYRNLDTPISTGTSTFGLTASEEFITYTIIIAPQPAP